MALKWTGERYLPFLDPQVGGAEIHYEHLHRYAFASQFVKDKQVLDLASGEGYGSDILANEAAKVIGIEIDSFAVSHATAKYQRKNLTFKQGSILDVPLNGENIYDVITCFEALEHIDKHDEFLLEVKRLLKSNGIFIVSTPNKKIYTDGPQYNNPYHLKELYFEELKTLLLRYFKHVYLYGQGITSGSNIWCINPKKDAKISEFIIEKIESVFRFVDEKNKSDPVYFISIASDVSLDNLININSRLIDKSNVITVQRDVQIASLSEHLQQEKAQKATLSQQLQLANAQEATLSQQLQLANAQKAALSQQLQLANAQKAALSQQLQLANAQTSVLSKEIAEMRRSVICQMTMKFDDCIVEKAFPIGSKRRKSYEAVLRSARAIANEGPSSFFDKKGFRSIEAKNLIRALKLPLRNDPTNLMKYPTCDYKEIAVSVVMPVYDRTWELKESIESIMNQSFQNFELIIVTDGSPKETMEIIDEYRNHPKVRIFEYEDNSGGPVRGRNVGIKEAYGKYIAFQDSDDIADENRLKWSIESIVENDVDIVYGGYEILNEGSRKETNHIKNGQLVYSEDCDLEKLKQKNVICQSTVMCKTMILRKVGGLKSKMHYREDHELWLRLAYTGYKFKNINKILCKLRLHKGNLEAKHVKESEMWLEVALTEYQKCEKSMLKLAYVVPGVGIGGGLAVVLEHCNRLLKRGYDVSLINMDEVHRDIDWFPGNHVKVFPLSIAPKNIDILVATEWRTVYEVKKMKAHKKFYFVQSDESRFYKEDSLKINVLNTYKTKLNYITEAKWIKKWLKENFGHDAIYVPNALNKRVFYKSQPMEARNETKLRVLLEGPIDVEFKGLEDAFNAVSDLDCEVWCVSSAGKPKPGWRCDRFFEKVPFNQMRYIYSSCDILLKMSRVEGFFGPPMEMMACGGCVVVGKVTGYDEYIENEYNGLVVGQRDVAGAKNAINRLIRDKSLRDKLIRNGWETVERWSNWENSINILEKIYFDIKSDSEE